MNVDDITLNFSPQSLQLLNAILAIVMFSIALDLKKEDFLAFVKNPKPLAVGLLSQFVALPFVTFLFVSAVQPAPSIALGLILIAACPGGNISNFITHRAGGNTALSVSLTGFSTLIAVLFTPLNISIWGSLYQPTRSLLNDVHVNPMSIFVLVFFMLLLPLTLGIFVSTKFPNIVAKIRKPLRMLSMFIFVAFVVLALAANWGFFVEYIALVAGLVVAHNALALTTGYTLSRLSGLSEFNRRAVMIETGIQNSGLGLILIFTFFNGLGGMAVVAAFWGIWHAISGIALARFLARKEAQR